MSIKMKFAAAALAVITLGTAAVATSGQAEARGWGWGPGLGVGIAAGALIGAAAAANAYGPGYYYGPAYPRCHRVPQFDAYGNYVGSTRVSEQILLEMWEKWIFLATLAGATCLMRASIGDIVAAPEGRDFVVGLLAECSAVAAASGHAPREAFLERYRAALTAAGSTLTASMLRDIERGAPIEADHIIGDLIARGKVIRGGSQFATAEAQIFDEQGKLIASGRGTYFTAPPKPA